MNKFWKYILLLVILSINCTIAFSQYIRPVFPKDGQMIYADTVHFHWNQHFLTSTYHLQIAMDTAFTQSLVNADVQGCDTIIRGFLPDTTYYWRIMPQGGTYGPCLKFIYFTPRMIPNLVGWYAADSTHQVNGQVDTIYDKSGNDLHLRQPGVNNRPTFVQNDTFLNDCSSMYFDGDDYLATYKDTLCSQPNTYILLVNKCSINNSFYFFTGQNTSNRNQFGYSPASSAFYYYAGTSKVIDTTLLKITQLEYGYMNVLFNKQNSKLIYNHQDIFVGNVGAQNMLGLRLGTKPSSDILQGYIPEFIYYHVALDSMQNKWLAQYMSEKYHGRLNLGENIAASSFCSVVLQPDREYESYLWSTGDTTKSISVLQNGTYWLTTINRFGWQETDTIEVVFPP
ncbi:MAG: hypothetical protein J5725_03745, partial [Bacteroidales bacterium]|nr:hypothetical protein [Bacteroidales bacterium]